MSEIYTVQRQTAGGAVLPVQRFDSIAISLHWLTLALIVAQFSAGWLHVYLLAQSPDALQWPESQLVIAIHRSLGSLIWLVTLGRIVWRLGFASLPPFPEHMPKFQRRMATANEYALYALLLLQPLTGLAQFLFRGRPFSLFFLTVPVAFPADPLAVLWFHQIHRFGAFAMLALIAAHALAAVFHHYVLKDNMLKRMQPVWRIGS